jgi:Flp pilus assembly protein TadG
MSISVTALRRLRRDSRGVTAVEFALVLPVILTLLLLVLEVSTLFLAQSLLESAALRGARLGSTGWTESDRSREQTVREYVASQAIGLLVPANLTVTPKAYADFAAIDTTPAASVPVSFGAPGQVVVYTFTYPWRGVTPFFQSVFAGRAIDLRAKATIRNEPYAS